MSTLELPGAVMRSLDLATLASPGRLLRPSRLYATVVDDHGAPGRRHFVAELPEGAAVFALAAPGVSFLLVEQGVSLADTLLAPGPIDAAALDAWHAALLSWPEFARSDGAAVLMVAGESRTLPQGAVVTARDIIWLQADAPVLRYSATVASEPSAAKPLLVLADQILAEVIEASEVRAATSASLLLDNPPAALSGPSALLAMRIAASLVKDDAAMAQRAEERLVRDEAEVSRAIQRLSDAAALRAPEIAAAVGGTPDPLAGALAVIAAQEGFNLRLPQDDDHNAFVIDRLERFGSASGFRFRPIALESGWWEEEGPSFLAIEAASELPRAVVWRRRRWRIVDPQTQAETAIDQASAAALLPRGYMLYPVLPEHVTMREIWRFTAFGARGDIARLMVGAAAAVLSSLLIPVTTGAVLGFAVPDGRTSLLADMMILLVAASIGNVGFQVVRAVAMIRLGSYIDRRLQPAIWDRVMRLRTSFFRGYSIGDLTLRILGIDTIRRIFAGQTLNALIGGIFSVANLGIMLIYDVSLAAFAVCYALVAAAFLFFLGRRKMQLDRLVLERKGVVTGLLMEILGGIAKLRVAAAELRAFSRWSSAFAEQRAIDGRSGLVGSWQIIASTSLPILGTLCVFAIAAGVIISSRSPPSPPSTAHLRSSPAPFSISPTPLTRRLRRCRFLPEFARCSRLPSRSTTGASIPALSADTSPSATCRFAIQVTGLGRSRESTSRPAQERAWQLSVHRARASRLCCACFWASRLQSAVASTTTTRISRRLICGGCAARSALCWRRPGSCRARSSKTSRGALRWHVTK